MKRSVFLVIFFAFGFLMTMAQDYSRYVDPRIGSEGLGRTFPGPCMPYGMAKPGPDAVSMPNAGWAPMPEPVKGFSQMHVSGTGGGQKYGNILSSLSWMQGTSSRNGWMRRLSWDIMPVLLRMESGRRLPLQNVVPSIDWIMAGNRRENS